MLILPGELSRWKALVPLRRSEWQRPTILPGQETFWRATARLDDGQIVWRSRTYDRLDFDRFVDALFRWHLCGVPMPLSICRLMAPEWHPGIVCRHYQFTQHDILYAIPQEQERAFEREYHVPLDWNNGKLLEFPNLDYWEDNEWLAAPGTYLTTASSSPWTVLSNWANFNNMIETIGPGGSGAIGGATTAPDTGAGGGGYVSDTNIPLVRGASQPFGVGDGGAALSSPIGGATAGNPGTADTVLGATTLPSPAAIIGAIKGSGGATGTSPRAGGVGGPTTSTKPTSPTAIKFAGGRGGNSPTGTNSATGGGGAAGPSAAGNNGTDAPGSNSQTAGGSGDGGSGGAGSAGVSAPPAGPGVSSAGGTGTEMDPSHGSGGGSGGGRSTVSAIPGGSGAGGNYGGGSGGGRAQAVPGIALSGKGGPGLIAITNTAVGGGLWLPSNMDGLGSGGPYFGPGRIDTRNSGSNKREIRMSLGAPKGRSFSGWPSRLAH